MDFKFCIVNIYSKFLGDVDLACPSRMAVLSVLPGTPGVLLPKTSFTIDCHFWLWVLDLGTPSLHSYEFSTDFFPPRSRLIPVKILLRAAFLDGVAISTLFMMEGTHLYARSYFQFAFLSWTQILIKLLKPKERKVATSSINFSPLHSTIPPPNTRKVLQNIHTLTLNISLTFLLAQ